MTSSHQQAHILAGQGKYREALGLLHVALQAQPTHETWALWASCQLALGDADQAEEGYRRALNLNPAESTYEVCLDELWRRKREQSEAQEFAQRGLKLLEEGKAADAEVVLYQAIRRHESAGLWNDWGSAAFLQGHPVEAEGGFRRALALDPAHLTAAGNLGLLLLKMARFQEALPWLQRVCERAPLEERTAWRAAVAECEAAAVDHDPRPEPDAAQPWIAEATLAFSRLQAGIEKLDHGLRDLRKQLPKPSSSADEQESARTLLERAPLWKVIGVDTQVRLLDPATVADSLPVSDRWLLGAIAASAGAGPMLHWGARNAITLDLAANAREGSVVWHVADAEPGFDPLEPSRLQSVRASLQERMQPLPFQSPDFHLSDWIGRMKVAVIDCNGTAEDVRGYTRSAMPFLAAEGSVAVWFGYGQWKGVTWAVNELFLSEPGFERMIHLADSNLALLIRPAAS